MLVEEKLTLSLEPNAGWDPRIHCARCGDLVRAYLIVCQRFVLVYDTLLGPQSGGWLRQRALELAEGRPLLVVNSHADWDHYFGNMAFPEPILGSLACAERIKGEVGAGELEKKRQEHPDCYAAVRLVGPSVALPGETVLDGGDLTLRLLPTVGHRPDHLALWVPEIATLFPGDCVEDPVPLVDEDSTSQSNTVQELIESLQMMCALQPQWVLANHAAPEPGTARMEANLAYLRRLQAQAARASSLDELRESMPSDPTWSDFYRDAHLAQTRMAWEQRGQAHDQGQRRS
jgi:glyoxylase-like metal-dependent hydrolase (beta-lactamase superfamily II)